MGPSKAVTRWALVKPLLLTEAKCNDIPLLVRDYHKTALALAWDLGDIKIHAQYIATSTLPHSRDKAPHN